MKHNLRILTLNMCSEYPGNKSIVLDKWIAILSKIEGDVLFLQEIESYNVERLAGALGLKILTIHQGDATCVLINLKKLVILDNHVVKLINSRKEPFYIGGLHLDDIPSISHHMDNKVYKSSVRIPLHYNLDKVLKLCVERRSPRVKTELAKTKTYSRAIIAGDFNEPSHLDLEINVPVSKLFEKQGFLDTFWVANKKLAEEKGHTWPASTLYKQEPGQRIDMIYVKNMKVVRSFIHGENTAKWMSDHKMVISDVEL
jgi:endonuclease/exonuclease/phosphatase family metal-dependent hydrolase